MRRESIWHKLFGPRTSVARSVEPLPQAEPGEAPAEIQSERPIGGAAEDRLDRASFAKRVARVLAERPGADSIVVGLYGPWGDGKTSALAMIQEALESDQSVVIVKYNPWFFSSDTEAITRSFFLTIGEALEQSGFFTKENIGSLLATYGGVIPNVGEAAKKLGEAMSVKELASARRHVESVLQRHQKRVIVFVDDIDRLDRKEIQALFKLVRLSGDFPYTAYVLAFDDGVVSDALADAYGGGETQAGRRFLEKIIQVPLHLPPASPETLRSMVFESCDRVLNASGISLGETGAHEFANQFSAGLLPALKTPRQVKLYDNALTFAVPLLKNEVSVSDQMLIEAIRIFHPALYSYIRDNPDRFLKAKERDARRPRDELETLIREVLGTGAIPDSDLRSLARLVEHLFPRTSSMGYGTEWTDIWSKARRVCAPAYFRRYFTYGVPAGDLSDAAVDTMIAAAAAGDTDGLVAVWRDAAAKKALEQLITKLRHQEDSLSVEAIGPLVAAIAALADQIPRSKDPFLGDHAFRQAAILIAHLVARTGDRREDLLEALLRLCPAGFAVEVLSWCELRTKDGQTQGFLKPEAATPLYGLAWHRLVDETADQPLFDLLGDDFARTLLAFVHGGVGDDVRAQVEAILAGDDGTALLALLERFTPRSWDMSTGVPRRSDLMRNTYDSIVMVADPTTVLEKLSVRFGTAIEVAEYPRVDEDEETPNLGLVHAQQFYFIHQHVIAQHAGAPSETEAEGG